MYSFNVKLFIQKNLDLKSKSFDLFPIYRFLNSIITNDNYTYLL